MRSAVASVSSCVWCASVAAMQYHALQLHARASHRFPLRHQGGPKAESVLCRCHVMLDVIIYQFSALLMLSHTCMLAVPELVGRLGDVLHSKL